MRSAGQLAPTWAPPARPAAPTILMIMETIQSFLPGCWQQGWPTELPCCAFNWHSRPFFLFIFFIKLSGAHRLLFSFSLSILSSYSQLRALTVSSLAKAKPLWVSFVVWSRQKSAISGIVVIMTATTTTNHQQHHSTSIGCHHHETLQLTTFLFPSSSFHHHHHLLSMLQTTTRNVFSSGSYGQTTCRLYLLLVFPKSST